jgi:hypothetical protein
MTIPLVFAGRALEGLPNDVDMPVLLSVSKHEAS